MAASTYVFEVMNKEQDNISNKIVRRAERKQKQIFSRRGHFQKKS